MTKNHAFKAAIAALLGGAILVGIQGCEPAPAPSTPETGHDHSHEGHDHAKSEAGHSGQPADNSPSSQLHAVMMRPMENMDMSGDVDTDFAALMIPHHQGAIDMAKIELEHGKKEELKKMAQAIFDSQSKEIEVLKKHASVDHTGHAHAAESGSPSMRLHEIMMRPMGDMKTTGDVDRDFAALMIPHHQGAIDMAKIEIAEGKNEELKKMAEAIIESQAKEIEVLKKHIGQ
ncbi:DUF305 domain-containing protein [bacterium]|nr:MAG: DUF305 domain-containing protein [bacterium]